MSEWISVEERLPEEKKYVLGIAPHAPFVDFDDPDHVKMVVVRLERGMTEKEVEMFCGLDVPYELRRGIGRSDQHGNNQRPYSWQEFGPGSFFGQDITHWQPLPDPPLEIPADTD